MDEKANQARDVLMRVDATRVPPPTVGEERYAGRQSCKALLLEHAERMRRDANQLENLAYQVDRIQGDAENTLWRLLQGDFFRR